METPKIYPCLSYRDARAAIDFLTRAFGFEQLLVVPGPTDAITHAELHLGPDVIMLGTARPELRWVSPLDLSGVSQTVCCFVPDVDAHYERAMAAGAQVVRELTTTSYGSREYSARDPEGHEWHFGTYRPAPDSAAA